MSYIKSDIVVFGIGVFIFIVLTLWFIFRNFKWVLMPLLGCATSVIIMIGLLGFIGWKVTVISSNFSIDAYFKYGYEYSFNCKILIEEEYPDLTKNDSCLRQVKKW